MKRSFNLLLWGIFLAAFAGHLLAQRFWFPPIGHDPLMRYAPMAEAFARGDWFMAFHPRFGTLFEVISGLLVWISGVGGNVATQWTATLGFTLTVVPLGAFVRRLHDERTAFWTVLLYLCVADFILLAGYAYRDDLRILGMALLALGSIEVLRPRADPGPVWGAAWFALGELVMITLRSDCFVIASLAVGVLGLVLLLRRRILELAVVSSGWLLGTLIECTLVYAYTGWFIPVPQILRYLEVTL